MAISEMNENRRCRATESSQVRCRTKTQHHAAIPNSRSLPTRYSCGRSLLTRLAGAAPFVAAFRASEKREGLA